MQNRSALFQLKTETHFKCSGRNKLIPRSALEVSQSGLRSGECQSFNLHTLCSLLSAIPAALLFYQNSHYMVLQHEIASHLTPLHSPANISSICGPQVGPKSTPECGCVDLNAPLFCEPFFFLTLIMLTLIELLCCYTLCTLKASTPQQGKVGTDPYVTLAFATRQNHKALRWTCVL